MNYCVDFSSSEDDLFDDDLDFQLHSHQRVPYNAPLTEEQKKEYRLKSFYISLINGKVEDVVAELDNGLNVNENLQNNWTPILLAASIANYDLIKILHIKGADVTSTREAETTLMLACKCPEITTSYEASTKAIELLLQLGVNPNAINKKRMNALMYAANNGNFEAVKLLLPVTDSKAEDNQHWNALFWAVCSGKLEIVTYLVDKGLPFDKIDVRGNTPLDVAKHNDFDNIYNLFVPKEDDNPFVLNLANTDFEGIFQDLQKNERPKFFSDIIKILHGTRCENLTKLFAEKEVNLFDFLTSTDDNFKVLGIQMPFQRRRLRIGIHRFHQYAYHPKSLPSIGPNELFSNIDAAAIVLCAVKQILTMEASLKYIRNNADCENLIRGDKEIRHVLIDIERKLQGLKFVVEKLGKKVNRWDYEVEEVNRITSKSGKRWFPWRKMAFTFGVVLIVTFKLWKQ